MVSCSEHTFFCFLSAGTSLHVCNWHSGSSILYKLCITTYIKSKQNFESLSRHSAGLLAGQAALCMPSLTGRPRHAQATFCYSGP